MNNIIQIPVFTRNGPRAETERKRLAVMFRGKSKEDMRALWDGVDDTSFCGPYDCADIHAYMNMTGDGGYCAV